MQKYFRTAFISEALQVGYLLPCSPEITICYPVPQNQNLDFLCSQFPKLVFVPMFPLFQTFVPLK